MAIKGSLKEASLPDVIQLLALGRKTGCLAVADRQKAVPMSTARAPAVRARSTSARE